jgi:heme oxygenase
MTLLEKLRTETRHAHDSIEQAMDLLGRLSSIHAYRSVLTRFYGFHVAWEEAAGPALDEPSFFDPRRKTGLLVRDLRSLGMTDSEIAVLPRCTPMMRMANQFEVLGAMYVMEGSTLGGTIIARQAQERLGLLEHTGCAYFRSYGPEVGRMWRETRARLTEASSPESDVIIVGAAQRMFGLMQDWLCGTPADERSVA